MPAPAVEQNTVLSGRSMSSDRCGDRASPRHLLWLHALPHLDVRRADDGEPPDGDWPREVLAVEFQPTVPRLAPGDNSIDVETLAANRPNEKARVEKSYKRQASKDLKK